MHGGDNTTSTATAAVVHAARLHLAAIEARTDCAEGEVDTLLEVTDQLLNRAAFDDSVLARRMVAGQLRRATGAELDDRVAALAAEQGDSAALRHLVDVLRQTEIGPLPPRMPTPVDTSRTTPAALADYLRGRGDPRELVSATAVPGGFSKETVLLELRTAGGDPEEAVLRKVAPGRAADSLADEYTVLRFVAKHGLPVARPLWFDADGGTLGAPLFATRRMPGSTVGTVTGPTEDATPDTARELATLLGRLHAIDATDLRTTPRPAMVTTQDLLAAIDARDKIVRGVADTLPDSPGLALYRALLTWLRANLPDLDGTSALVHGDVGFHNLLVDSGRISALLDWEVAHLGRPAEDLAYVRPSVATLLDWDEFVNRYRDAGGAVTDEAELRFFSVWQDVWRATSCLRLRTKFLLDPTRLADGVSGLLLSARFLDSALRTAFGAGR